MLGERKRAVSNIRTVAAGLAKERRCDLSDLVFTTQDEYGRAVWLLDRYDTSAGEIRYVNVRSTTLTTIDISVRQDGKDASLATVTYKRTALDPRGEEGVASFAHHFPMEGPHWESAINAALASK